MRRTTSFNIKLLIIIRIEYKFQRQLMYSCKDKKLSGNSTKASLIGKDRGQKAGAIEKE